LPPEILLIPIHSPAGADPADQQKVHFHQVEGGILMIIHIYRALCSIPGAWLDWFCPDPALRKWRINRQMGSPCRRFMKQKNGRAQNMSPVQCNKIPNDSAIKWKKILGQKRSIWQRCTLYWRVGPNQLFQWQSFDVCFQNETKM